MKWFKDTFLPSLEERYNARNGKLWLTKKQVAVCRNYMTFSNTVRGAMHFESGEKIYCIQIAPNGCASFHVV